MDQLTELTARLERQDAKIKNLIEIAEKHTTALQQQADSLRHLANDAAGNASWRSAIEDVLAQHRSVIKDLQTGFRKLAGPPVTPSREVN